MPAVVDSALSGGSDQNHFVNMNKTKFKKFKSRFPHMYINQWVGPALRGTPCITAHLWLSNIGKTGNDAPLTWKTLHLLGWIIEDMWLYVLSISHLQLRVYSK
jgi:hypothetical protein